MTRIMFPYIVFISLTTLASGVLNTYKQFSLPAFAPVLLNVRVHRRGRVRRAAPESAGLRAGVGGDRRRVAAVSRAAAGAEEDRHDAAHRAAISFARCGIRGVKRVLAKMVPATFAVSGRRRSSLIINTNIASQIGPGAVSWINYADRLMEFPTALLGVALGTILLPSLSKAHVDADPHEYSALLDWGLRITFLLAAPSAVALFFFAEPLTATLFPLRQIRCDIPCVMVARALAAYGIGLSA